MTTPDPPAGIVCPRCGCADLRAYCTRRLRKNRIRRYRTCRHCGKRITTIETTPNQSAPNGQE